LHTPGLKDDATRAAEAIAEKLGEQGADVHELLKQLRAAP
jgi:hypothetical protein